MAGVQRYDHFIILEKVDWTNDKVAILVKIYFLMPALLYTSLGSDSECLLSLFESLVKVIFVQETIILNTVAPKPFLL